MHKYIRTCQSCGRRQEARDPRTYSTDTWRDKPCCYCRSPDLDYGSWREVDERLIDLPQPDLDD